jgi:hypothetical protein
MARDLLHVLKNGKPRLETRINERDIQHLHAFSNERKTAVMRRIMSRRPDKTIQLNGKNDFEKTMLQLRREGYGLIDLQRHEASFSSVWYRRGVSVLGRRREHVAMLVWEAEEPGPQTTVLSWRV